MTSMAGMPPAETTILLTSTILRGVNNGVLYRCDLNCKGIFGVATDCLLRLAPAAIQQSNRCLNACSSRRFWLPHNCVQSL